MTTLNSIQVYTILYHTYKLLHCNRHISLTSNHSNINVEINKNNRVNKLIILNLIHLQIILHYVTLADYYIAKRHIQLTSNHSNVNVEINKTIE